MVASLNPLALEIAGEAVELHAQRALYWPRARRLLIADLHLGKGDIFRRAGISLPSGGTGDDLARLSALLFVTRAGSLWILGDMLHGPVHDAAWQNRWRQWREAHRNLEVAALIGNHDRALARADLGIELLGAGIDKAPFAFRHAPETHPTLHVLCGHLHPQVALPGMRRRWPAFWLRPGLTMLPAFSAFTGGVVVTPLVGECVAICADDSVTLLRS